MRSVAIFGDRNAGSKGIVIVAAGCEIRLIPREDVKSGTTDAFCSGLRNAAMTLPHAREVGVWGMLLDNEA